MVGLVNYQPIVYNIRIRKGDWIKLTGRHTGDSMLLKALKMVQTLLRKFFSLVRREKTPVATSVLFYTPP